MAKHFTNCDDGQYGFKQPPNAGTFQPGGFHKPGGLHRIFARRSPGIQSRDLRCRGRASLYAGQPIHDLLSMSPRSSLNQSTETMIAISRKAAVTAMSGQPATPSTTGASLRVAMV